MLKKKIGIIALFVCVISVFTLASCKVTDGDDHAHNYVASNKSPTCTEVGHTGQMCTVCGEVEILEYIPENGHTPGDWEISQVATCFDNKVEKKLCTVCSEVVETKTGEKLEHIYNDGVSVAGTCVVPGHTLYTCERCGTGYKDKFTTLSECIPGEWVITVKADCQNAGTRAKFCKICKTELESEMTPVSEVHDFTIEEYPSSGDVAGYTKYTCKVCKHEETINHTATLAPSEIYRMISGSMVRIEACDKDGNVISVGSGFFISTNGEIATNYHVIRGAYSLNVKSYNSEAYEVSYIIDYDSDMDIAIIKVNGDNTSCLEISTSKVKTGDPVYTLGSPLGIDNIFSNGIVSNSAANINGVMCIAFTAPISSGNSGGPLVNGKGQVVGINSFTATDGENLNFAVMISSLDTLEKDKNMTVAALYEEKLKENAFEVLVNYIGVNKDGKYSEHEHYIYKFMREQTDTTYGLEYWMVYNTNDEKIYFNLYLTSYDVHRFMFQMVIDSDFEKYEVNLFDYNLAQNGFEGVVDPSVQLSNTYDVSLFDKIFTVNRMHYNEKEIVSIKQIVYNGYLNIVKEFKEVLENSETGLILEHFQILDPK